jgi:RhtB (resistance to homoserine/threonine) family protein
MEYLPYLLTAYAIFMLAVLSPGPNFLAVTGTAMTISRRAGLGLALGVGCGTLCWSSITMLGLTAILAASADVAIALRWAGGAYLMFLGYKSLRSALRLSGKHPATATDASLIARPDRPFWRYIRRGLLVQAGNPKAALFWLSVMSIVLRPDAPGWVAVAIVAGTTSISFAWHMMLAWFFSTPAVMRVYRRAQRTIEGVLGAAFLILGGKLLAG